jgi:hypothetical protein
MDIDKITSLTMDIEASTQQRESATREDIISMTSSIMTLSEDIATMFHKIGVHPESKDAVSVAVWATLELLRIRTDELIAKLVATGIVLDSIHPK